MMQALRPRPALINSIYVYVLKLSYPDSTCVPKSVRPSADWQPVIVHDTMYLQVQCHQEFFVGLFVKKKCFDISLVQLELLGFSRMTKAHDTLTGFWYQSAWHTRPVSAATSIYRIFYPAAGNITTTITNTKTNINGNPEP